MCAIITRNDTDATFSTSVEADEKFRCGFSRMRNWNNGIRTILDAMPVWNFGVYQKIGANIWGCRCPFNSLLKSLLISKFLCSDGCYFLHKLGSKNFLRITLSAWVTIRYTSLRLESLNYFQENYYLLKKMLCNVTCLIDSR